MGREMRQGPGGRKSHILQVVRIGRVHRQTKKSRNFQTDRKPHILGDNVQVADKERWGKVGISFVQCNLLFITLLRVKESESESHSVVSDSLRPHGLYDPWNSPGQKTGVGCYCLLQGIFPTQGSNPCLLHCRQILYHHEPSGKPTDTVNQPQNFLMGSSCILTIFLKIKL